MFKVIQRIVEHRLATPANTAANTDMLDSFLSRGLTPTQATNELLVVMYVSISNTHYEQFLTMNSSSGVGATAYAIQGIIRCIIASPGCQSKLQEDIDYVVSSEGYGSTCVVNESIVKQMPYFQACITEGLRLYPPVSLLRERVVSSEGEMMHGFFIPGGTFVGLNGPASKLHPVYGNNPEEFHPERWLMNDEAQLKQMARNMELVFGYGTSKCLGVDLAYTELNKIVFELFRHYTLRFTNQEHPWTARGDFILADFGVVASQRK